MAGLGRDSPVCCTRWRQVHENTQSLDAGRLSIAHQGLSQGQTTSETKIDRIAVPMILKAIMRYFAYLFHALLALFLIAVSGLAMASGGGDLRLKMLPWEGDTLERVVLIGALVGLVTVLLAMRGVLRILFLIWSFLVFVMLVKGYIFSGYKFHANEFRTALYLIAASFLALLGAWFQLQRRP